MLWCRLVGQCNRAGNCWHGSGPAQQSCAATWVVSCVLRYTLLNNPRLKPREVCHLRLRGAGRWRAWRCTKITCWAMQLGGVASSAGGCAYTRTRIWSGGVVDCSRLQNQALGFRICSGRPDFRGWHTHLAEVIKQHALSY